MSTLFSGIFTTADQVQMQSLNHRLKRSELITANVANAETPGYRSIGYDFEEQLQDLMKVTSGQGMKVSHPKHFKSSFVQANGQVKPDVFVRPTESIGQDGNTVDVDNEMARMAQNQILYRSAVETINRKVGILRYAIQGGR